MSTLAARFREFRVAAAESSSRGTGQRYRAVSGVGREPSQVQVRLRYRR